MQIQSFMTCIESNKGEIGLCQNLMNEMATCQNPAAQL